MSDFKQHTIESAPDAAKPLLEGAKENVGFVPNLYATLAEAPPALEAYLKLGEIYGKSSLSAVERNVVWLTAAAENDCHYCVAAHTGLAKGARVPDQAIDAIRDADPVEDERLEALRIFTETVVSERGWAREDDVQAFLNAGFTKANVLEVVLGVAHKTISNYVNHIADTPLDSAFSAFSWDGTGEGDRNPAE